jgi:hypothetical protein
VSPVHILRFRLPKTGTIVPIQVNEEDFKNTPLSRMVEGVLVAQGGSSSSSSSSSFYGVNDNEYECTCGTEMVDTSQPPYNLGLKHGTLLTITPRKFSRDRNTNVTADMPSSNDRRRQKRQGHQQTMSNTETIVPFDPFPHLAKPRFNEKRRAIRAKANRRGGMSYSDLDQLSASIHKVETQSDPILARIYMCSKSAEAFFASCSSTSSTSNVKMKKKKTQQKHKCALLFGTVSKEKVKTSTLLDGASTVTASDKKDRYCEVAKVHALYEPPQQKLLNGYYDATSLIALETSTTVQRAIQLAKRLNLQPVGWIYTHNNDSITTKKNEVPVSARDVVIAAKIQAALMKTLGRETGGRFVTVSLDVANGESEAFQMSDQCIQMVAEGVLLLQQESEAANDEDNYGSSNNSATTVIKTSSPVIVDGKEMRTVDCLLCLVNTGMLSHTGSLSGDGDIIGKLTSKVKQKLRTYLTQGDDSKTIQYLSNFNLLLTLSKVLTEADFNELCGLITKSTRRTKVILSKHLQLTLESIASA